MGKSRDCAIQAIGYPKRRGFFCCAGLRQGLAEEACFETIILSADSMAAAQSAQRPLPGGSKITILQSPENTQGKMPGFGYWLFVVLVAISVFWITGGHTLFMTPR
jgi:hypothetical protein